MNDALAQHVVAYFVPCPDLWAPDTQLRLIEIWKRSWELRGWVPSVLSEEHARMHPRFQFFREHIASKPTRWPRDYSDACFTRWLAAAHYSQRIGQPIMLADYDVINYGLPPQEVRGEMNIFTDGPNIRMGSILGKGPHFLDMLELFIAASPCEHDHDPSVNVIYQDDNTLVARMMDTHTLPCPPWLTRRPGMAWFPEETWTTAPLVHYGYAMHAKGYWPKCDYIEKIRPL